MFLSEEGAGQPYQSWQGSHRTSKAASFTVGCQAAGGQGAAGRVVSGAACAGVREGDDSLTGAEKLHTCFLLSGESCTRVAWGRFVPGFPIP